MIMIPILSLKYAPLMLFPQTALPVANSEKQKSRGLFLCLLQHAGGCFLLSPKGPPSCWRAKPIIKAKL
jgi:hypothetical protein